MLYAPLFLLIIASIAITGVKADPAPYMFVDPPTAEISAVGQNITIKVNVTTVSNLYGYETQVSEPLTTSQHPVQ